MQKWCNCNHPTLRILQVQPPLWNKELRKYRTISRLISPVNGHLVWFRAKYLVEIIGFMPDINFSGTFNHICDDPGIWVLFFFVQRPTADANLKWKKISRRPQIPSNLVYKFYRSSRQNHVIHTFIFSWRSSFWVRPILWRCKIGEKTCSSVVWALRRLIWDGI